MFIFPVYLTREKQIPESHTYKGPSYGCPDSGYNRDMLELFLGGAL